MHMTPLCKLTNALGVTAGLIGLAAMIGAAGHLLAGGARHNSNPEMLAGELVDLIESAQLEESKMRSE